MARSNLRLLLNAEAFGFGPTAAIADIFPHLRKLFSRIGYVGSGHTLDLQRPLPYDEFCPLTGEAGDDDEFLDTVFAGYDVFLTALDFGMAERARRAGLWVAIYDPLTWYWKEIAPAIADCDLYLAQDFFGVRERIEAQAEKFGRVVIVPPIVSPTPALEDDAPRKHVLLNLGGLNNPFWTADDSLAYARLVVSSVVSSGAVGEPLVIAANAAIASALSEYGVVNYSREQMQAVLAGAKYAFMTPGLGNIYDSARHKVPTVWLPPANDSQGQQLNLLVANGMADGVLDWHHFVPDVPPFDYSSDQAEILKRITALVDRTAGSGDLQAALAGCMVSCVNNLRGRNAGGSCALTARFGGGGAELLAQTLLEAVSR